MPDQDHTDVPQYRLPRRQALACAGIAFGTTAIASCATYGNNPAPPPPAGEQAAPALAKTADVPVGSALIVDDTVLTQPKAGEFAGFSSVCPHAGCAVSKVDGAQVSCPCHGSTFGLDGAVISGPARDPLTPAPITVRGDSIVAG
ncbi:Rieske (2Fe-2S) protein [Mycolicibacterium sp. P9-22]|uniref:Rieske (2Fe-2S) protein n=1 Tax=Mycolicibacterium sp. P9-22 TaxID=2024613 RepID=UPI0011EEE153|nr:Rieske (2Fe-2S) protein [Mycolicibacterium sp. P9-22]KAA0110424.1 Rieske (2Fe-2S) protein [Mycolicibacterium sp. P9-22]